MFIRDSGVHLMKDLGMAVMVSALSQAEVAELIVVTGQRIEAAEKAVGREAPGEGGTGGRQEVRGSPYKVREGKSVDHNYTHNESSAHCRQTDNRSSFPLL